MVSQDSIVFFDYDKELYELRLHVLPKDREILFSFAENEVISLSCSNQNYDLYLETGNEDDSSPYRGMEKIVFPVERKVFSDNNTSLCPGIYCLWIGQKGRILGKYFFQVTPTSAIEDDTFQELRSALESYDTDLLYDFTRKKYFSPVSRTREKNSVMAISSALKQNQARILCSLRNILLHPLEEPKKVLHKGVSAKSNAKTEELSFRKNREYSYKTRYDVDNRENRTLLFSLNRIYHEIPILNEKLKSLIRSRKEKIDELEELSVSWNRNPSHIQKEINGIDKEKENLESLYLSNQTILNEIETVLYDPRFRFVKPKYFPPSGKLLKNPGYRYLFRDLTDMIHQGFEEQSEYSMLSRDSYALKSTSDLYELYVLFFLVRILSDCGFTLNQKIDYETLGIQNEDYEIDMKKENTTCRIIFDRKIEKETLQDDLINLYATHDRPDYQVIFIDHRGNPFYIALFDAKCRKLKNIDIENNRTLFYTAKDYITFRYQKGKEPWLRLHGIDDLYFIYPEKNEDTIKQENYFGMKYLSLRPAKNLEKESSYQLMKKHFDTILEAGR